MPPGFLSLYDDPTLPGYDGSYRYDDEGVPAQRVVLVENGILKNYLHSRETAGKFGHKLGKPMKSNGHARADNRGQPTPRMSNIVVKSENERSMEELKEMMLKECREKGKEYGLMLLGTSGGFVVPELSFFHTFPKKIIRLYTDGREERVKGIYLVSTPYQMLDNIVATSDHYDTFQGTCGAESGWIPSTEIAPEAYIKSVEYGIIPRSEYRKYFPFLSKPPKK